jgi:cobalt-zinc-cadmium efflux system membrane fusion protein
MRNSTLLLLLAAALLGAGCGAEEEQGIDGARVAAAQTTAETVGAVQATEPPGAVCGAHGAPASVCFLCDASLRDPGRLWCGEHARYEDRCWLCHPELQDPDRLYCGEHGVYEDECFYCHPDLLSAAPSLEPAGEEPPSAELFCNEHGVYERECGICQPVLADGLLPGQGLKIRLPSGDAGMRSGIGSAPVDSETRSLTVTVPGELRFNQNRLARITPQVEGVVRAVHVDLGEDVEAGTALLEISGPGIAEAKGAFLLARTEERIAREQIERESSLHGQGVSSERELHQAQVEYAEVLTASQVASQRLLDLGLAERDLAQLAETGEADSRLVIRAPFGGTVIERQAVVGDVVSAGDRLLALCDLSTVWLDLSVPAEAVSRLSPGAPVVIRPPHLGRSIEGEVSWIADQLDPSTRLARMRAVFPNLDRRLKAGTYVDAEVGLGTREGAVPVARDDVHRFGGHPFVFLELEPDLYEVRRVELGGDVDGRMLVVAGLDPGDQLVVERSYLVKSEFQKSRLGAGCVD